jgi:hypothetical protein
MDADQSLNAESTLVGGLAGEFALRLYLASSPFSSEAGSVPPISMARSRTGQRLSRPKWVL